MKMQKPSDAIRSIGLALLVAGCGGSKPYVRPGFLDQPPRRVAVLPFVLTYPYDLTEDQAIPESHQIGREVLRKTFYYGLTPYGYDDLPLAEVDRRLTERWGSIEQGGWRQASPQQLGEALGVDAVIYGELPRVMHLSTPFYTDTSLDASLRMVDATSGQVLWRTRVNAAERGGALLKKGQVVDFVKDQVRSFTPKTKLLRVADVAVKKALAKFPNPPMSADRRPAPMVDGRSRLRLAVLPLGTEQQGKDWNKVAEGLRRYLVANLQASPFELIEIQRVDAALQELGWSPDHPAADVQVLQMGQMVGADALLRGMVTDWGRGYLVVESWVKAGLDVELLDARHGEVVWSETKKNTRHAGVLKGPTGFQSLATAPLKGLFPGNLERVANHLTRAIAEDLSTSPLILAYLDERRQPVP